MGRASGRPGSGHVILAGCSGQFPLDPACRSGAGRYPDRARQKRLHSKVMRRLASKRSPGAASPPALVLILERLDCFASPHQVNTHAAAPGLPGGTGRPPRGLKPSARFVGRHRQALERPQTQRPVCPAAPAGPREASNHVPGLPGGTGRPPRGLKPSARFVWRHRQALGGAALAMPEGQWRHESLEPHAPSWPRDPARAAAGGRSHGVGSRNSHGGLGLGVGCR